MPEPSSVSVSDASDRSAGPTDGSELWQRVVATIPRVLQEKHGDLATAGWGPRQRDRFGHRTPADWYEALLDVLVTPATIWLDVGCGRDISPGNEATARRLADRCRKLVGIDPSDNIDDNQTVHERLKMPIEDHPPGAAYDLITMRMVAEHIESPRDVVGRLAALLAPGGRIVIYTVSKYSPSVLIASATPMSVHHAAKHVLWRTEERDTFPTTYRMNTRGTLAQLFAEQDMTEEMFELLPDCRTTSRFERLQFVELSLWKLLSSLGIPYPETCILAVYRAK